MRLTRVRLRDWMPFPDVDLDLTDVSSAVIVGENGAGKSALLDAITWAIYDRTRQPGGGEGSSPDKLIREGADSTSVFVEWEAGGRLIGVLRERFRGREGRLHLTVDGTEETHHTAADTRAAAIRYAGLAFAPMIAGPMMVQAGLYPNTVPDSLLRAAPSARKDVMAEVFGATEWAPLHERAKASRDEALGTVAALERRLGELEHEADGAERVEVELAAARGRLAEAEQKLAEVDERATVLRERSAALAAKAEQLRSLRTTVTELAAAIASDNVAVERQQAAIAEARRQSSAPEPSLEAPDPSVYDAAIAAAHGAVREAQEARVQLGELRGEVATLHARVSAVDAAVATYESTVASVPCGGVGEFAACRFLTAKPDPQSVAADRERGRALQAQIAEIKELAGTLEERQQQLAEREVERRRAEQEANAVKRAHDEWELRRSSATTIITASEAEITRLGERIRSDTARLDAVTRERDGLAAEVGEAESIGQQQARIAAERASALGAKQEAERPVRQLEVQLLTIERAQQALAREQAALDAARQDVRVYTDLAAAFHRDGIPTMLIEEAIPLIEQHANDVLGRMPGDLRLSLVTGRLTGAGTISDRLDIVVSDAGYERDHVMLSIGQRFRVDLALRVALGRVLAHRSGITVRTLWLDEPLAALDARARQAVVETLNAVSSEFGLIIVVSHNEEINDAFGSRITVTRDGSTSTAVLV